MNRRDFNQCSALAGAGLAIDGLVAFARRGNPNHRGIPQWPAFDGTRRGTMVFGDEAKVVNDPGGEERLALKASRDRQATTKTADNHEDGEAHPDV